MKSSTFTKLKPPDLQTHGRPGMHTKKERKKFTFKAKEVSQYSSI